MSLNIKTLVQYLSQDAKLDLFELDLSPVTGTNTTDDHVYFHAGTNALNQNVVWQGKTYLYLPVEAEGFDISGKGAIPRPKLAISNVFSAVSAIIEEVGGDITGAKVIRRQTYARYLDAVNFPPRVSLYNYTEDIANWSLSDVTVTSNFALDVRNELKADKMSETATTSTHQVSQASSGSFAVGKTITAWIEVKSAGVPRVNFGFAGTSGTTGNIVFEFGTGKTISASNLVRYVAQPIGQDGWWFLMIVTTIPSAGNIQNRIRAINAANQGNYLGNPANALLIGRTQTVPGTPQLNVDDVRNVYQYQPYQYVGADYNTGADSDPTRGFPDETFFIERKVNEDDVSVEFELSSLVDFDGLKLPRRTIIVLYCGHDEYRGEGCMYAGTNYFDENDVPVTNVAQDICSRTPNGCKVRFGANNPLPFGGFPAARTYKM